MMELGNYILTEESPKNLKNHVTHPLSSADISIFSPEIASFAISRNKDIDCISVRNFELV